MYFFEKALEYIFLPSCGICGKLGEGYLCKKCEKCLRVSEINEVEYLDVQAFNKIEVMHIFKYDTIRNLILQYKFNDNSYLYRTFCEIIIKNKKVFDFIKSYDIIIPVPIHKKRLRERGYNQSELISKKLADMMNLESYNDVLAKVKNNKPQSTLNKSERKENTKDVYKLVNFEKIYTKKVLIFDDVYTTGATVKACIKEIEKANPMEIGVLTLAKD